MNPAGPKVETWQPFHEFKWQNGKQVPNGPGTRPEGDMVGCYLFSCRCRNEKGGVYYVTFPGLLNPRLESKPILWGLTPLHDIEAVEAWRDLPEPHLPGRLDSQFPNTLPE